MEQYRKTNKHVRSKMKETNERLVEEQCKNVEKRMMK